MIDERVDIKENNIVSLSLELLEILLIDRTIGKSNKRSIIYRFQLSKNSKQLIISFDQTGVQLHFGHKLERS